MKIIDLLNKIANGEEVPEKIKIETHIFIKYDYSMGDGTFVPSYESNNDGEYHINDFLYPQYLNDEIEIIEEEKKIPEKYVNTYVLCDSDFERKGQYSLKATEIIDKAFEEYSYKINEIIDYLNSKGE